VLSGLCLQFENLIETKPLTIAFPEYTGPQELRACIEFIANQFASKLKPTRAKPMVLLMAARVKKDVQYCFESVERYARRWGVDMQWRETDLLLLCVSCGFLRDVKDTLIDINRKGIKRAQAKLDTLRDQYRHEQLVEMERVASARKKAAQAAILLQQSQQGMEDGETHEATQQPEVSEASTAVHA
jgi:hypothetical protein